MGVVELHGRVMASSLHVIATDGEGSGPATARLHDAVQRAIRFVEHLERSWSRFIPTSDISRINRLGPTGGALAVDPATFALLDAMVDGHEITTGRYDPTLLRALIAEGYAASRTDPTMMSLVAPSGGRHGSLSELIRDPATGTVAVPPGLVLDPGGIGKGLAADLAVSQLLADGAAGAMVEIGGDLAAAGVPLDPAGWLIDVEHPDPHEGILCHLAISGGGVATSSVRSRRWTHDGTDRHHQIDPATSTCSTTDIDAVTVIAPCGWMAEVHATAALMAGSDGAIAHLEGYGLSGIAVARTPNGQRVRTTHDLADVEIALGCGAS